MELTKDMQKLVEMIKSLDWGVQVEEVSEDYTILLISNFSPAGQDFNATIEAEEHIVDNFIYNLGEYYKDFDVSYETYLWLDDTGHGTNGAPYDMEDLYEDMKWCKNALNELYQALYNYDWDYEDEEE